ncbi:hypothetical protein [Streptacidiphilus sp. PAMC 29251]
MGGWDADQLHRMGGPETVALARALLARVGERTCICGTAPDPGICPISHSKGLPAGGHCACVHAKEATDA